MGERARRDGGARDVDEGGGGVHGEGSQERHTGSREGARCGAGGRGGHTHPFLFVVHAHSLESHDLA